MVNLKLMLTSTLIKFYLIHFSSEKKNDLIKYQTQLNYYHFQI